ncbi:Hydrolase, alpha/beta fold family [Pseudomonas chlororaphis subsp. aurantiaca]|uniref:alpha/beta fold hydrolase n=1 Tax=Pseudomonas chlororaphis TaxID=587753 RepID=UPI0008798E0F|nr:alpha/beta hydrolase [Pseudomonas chlororaphis]AZD35536.1 Hydrolase, alpha/beta fold family [Pseudomonas chlororaphis subsp. aurantiaca]AZD41870.1 Hydrolase, alpha/beta fold family [Pseudomonas chlororaphis subsp. aurantiaca]AZD66553.1 Hydrolase, alpha/beta fold family [Pseudomonas chlororaphis subsp. aurantiaca]QIT22617.1 alpha/beta hydrolase [Pseudomonas chlororaphis subsp. aurantiaca]WDH06783.1 alpha/beta hydrolase [Pseudomonas chlororaphis]
MTPTNTNSPAGSQTSYVEAQNQSITVNGIPFAYRDIGPRTGVPLVLFNHWGAVLDNFDPAIIDGLAQTRRVIATDYRGIGGSGGIAPLTVGEMADDGIQLIRALGLDTVDVLGFSLGGFVAQDIALKAPGVVRRLILTGTGPAGGSGIDKVGSVSWPLILKGLLTLRDPKFYLFFTSTPNGRRAASQYLQRLKARKKNRDKGPTPSAFLRQLKAITAWGKQAPQDLGRLRTPTLIVNGDNDIMVPSVNSIALANRIPNAQWVIYEDAGHGGIFQHYIDFVAKALAFLDA